MIVWRSKAVSNSVSLISNVRMDVLTRSFIRSINIELEKKIRQAVCCLFTCSHQLVFRVYKRNRTKLQSGNSSFNGFHIDIIYVHRSFVDMLPQAIERSKLQFSSWDKYLNDLGFDNKWLVERFIFETRIRFITAFSRFLAKVWVSILFTQYQYR